MELFLYYLLRASVLMALFYGFYKLFLAGSTFHHINRILLIFIVLTVFLLPLFHFHLIPEKKTDPVTETFLADLSSIPVTEFVETQPPVEIPWMQILIVLFAAGFLFALVRYLIGLGQIAAIIRKSERQTLADNTVLCMTDKDISPFSWVKYIVLPCKGLPADNRAVIRHERAHIRLRHSFDMVFLDIFTCIFWFNPFSWLLRREIQSVHEYQADEQVLLSGIDAKQYQLLLIRKSVGEYKFALANNFRQRDLHKRIIMMKKNKTNKRMKWNYMAALPILFLAMIVLSVSKLNAKAAEKESAETIGTVAEKITAQVEDRDIRSRAVVNRSKIVVSGYVKDSHGIITGASIAVKGTNIGTITDSQGKFVLKVDKGSTLVFSMINYKSAEYVVEKSEDNLVIILQPDDVITVGVGAMRSFQGIMQDVEDKSKESKEVIGISTLSGKRPLYVVDGKQISHEDMQKINTEKIDAVSVLKNEASTSLYGEDGKNGVVLITTKKPENSSLHFKPDSLLIIIDGKEMPRDFDLNTLKPAEIESIDVLKGKSTNEIYGGEGRNRVIMITTKKSNSDKK
ncbi:MAG TPA: TonB-dependent receptor plug domain-containing protein [Petrimonas sp.]|uniref:TonB-dependent receptor plug domain-containing protein n=1 Tax=Petrimonas sp. TaxID=2023866 RepID=UPI00175BF8A8|nr:TonB-dependent receptor plug domain-containing protein [Petrimonas sp.]HHV86996.1 TonB-dependent receptor plug domain-containing protein [Petrimonas sp.]